MKKLKIGFVIKGSTINAYEKDLIKQLSTINEQFEKPILISFNYKKKRFFLNNLLIKLINLFEIYIIKKNKIFNKNHIVAIHREAKSKDELNDIIKIIQIKKYGRSKIIFGIFN